MKVTAFAGGVGGARLADGLKRILPPGDLTVIVNVGDDFEHFGLKICPDLDTVCYTLAGLADPSTGWGRSNETFRAFESAKSLGGPGWFRLGDLDLGTHLERTRLLNSGYTLSRVTECFCRSWGVDVRVLPVTDDPVPTWVITAEGDLPFQEYFVHYKCEPAVKGFRFAAVEKSSPAPGVLEAIREAELLVYCPSNPWVSIDPILAVPGVREAAASRPAVAVSPIIAGKTVKGPAAKMYSELGIQPSALAVARHYGSKRSGGLLSGFVFDRRDAGQEDLISAVGLHTLPADTLMLSPEDRQRLASDVLAFGEECN